MDFYNVEFSTSFYHNFTNIGPIECIVYSAYGDNISFLLHTIGLN